MDNLFVHTEELIKKYLEYFRHDSSNNNGYEEEDFNEVEEDESYKFKDEETSQSEQGYDRDYEQGDLDPSESEYYENYEQGNLEPSEYEYGEYDRDTWNIKEEHLTPKTVTGSRRHSRGQIL